MGEMKRQPEREREQKTGVIITSALPAIARKNRRNGRQCPIILSQRAGREPARQGPCRWGMAPALSVTFPETGAPPHPFLPGFAQPGL